MRLLVVFCSILASQISRFLKYRGCAIISPIVSMLRKIGFLGACALWSLTGCVLNSPYRAEERGKNILYSTFSESPKTLDPAVTYSSDAYEIINLIYEMPFQYHYLKRPYELIPSAAVSIPKVVYYNKWGKKLGSRPPAEEVARAVYEIKIKPGIHYQPHPAFARDAQGRLRYHALTARDVASIRQIKDFDQTGTKELLAEDYIRQIKRLADPLLNCPILATMEKYLHNMDHYAAALQKDLKTERDRRKKLMGNLYSQEQDEKDHPIRLDMDKYSPPGVLPVPGDPYAFRIILKAKYPQILYWLAMPFFCPIPQEVLDFYRQPALMKKNITLDRFPVGTGPYMLETNALNKEITLIKNPNFHGEAYPSEGEKGDREKGLLDDAGKPIPFVDRKVLKLEKEALPTWNKFLQGYLDAASIPNDSFDQAIQISAGGQAALTSYLVDRAIRLETSVAASTVYFGFNMNDPIVGGYTEDKQKIRQAISIALDVEERIEIFLNGRGIPAHDILAPGIFGYEGGQSGMNPYIYQWDEKRGKPVRKSIEEAKNLLAEAGYPGGKDKLGKQLVIGFDNSWTTAGSAPLVQWLIKKFDAVGIRLEPRMTDYNRFQEKIQAGNFQLCSYTWNADYPDPENFLFLLYGPNSSAKHHGENHSNYHNPDFDRLFKKMESMENGPERLVLIREMKGIMQKDAPLVWGYHPVGFGLYHSWLYNPKPNVMANNTFKYLRIDPLVREQYRTKRNPPVWWPVGLALSLLAGSVILAVWTVRHREDL